MILLGLLALGPLGASPYSDPGFLEEHLHQRFSTPSFVGIASEALPPLQAGWMDLARGRYDEAVGWFEKIPEKTAAAEAAGLGRAWALYYLKRYEEALEHLDPLIRRDPLPVASDQAVYLAGLCRYNLKMFREAAAAWERLAQDFPESSWAEPAQFGLAVALWRLKDPAGAAEAFAAYRNRYAGPRAEAALLGWFGAAFQAGRWTEAAKTSEEFILTHPKDPRLAELRFLRAEALLSAGRTSEAEAQYRRIMAEHGKDRRIRDQAHLGIGISWMYRKQWAGARRFFLDFQKHHPRSPYADDAQYYLGELHFRRGSYKKAVIAWTGLLQKYPRSDRRAETYYRLGETWKRRGSLSQARSYFDRCRKEDPEGPFAALAMYEIGRIHQTAGRPAEALEAYEEIVGKFPDHPLTETLRYRIGRWKFDEGDYAASAVALKEFVERHPRSDFADNALLQLVRAYLALNEVQAAAAEAQRLISDYGRTEAAPWAWYYLGQARLREKKISEALQAFEAGRRVSDDPELAARCLLGQAEALEQSGRTEKAEEMRAGLLKKYPKSEAAAGIYLNRGKTLEESQDFAGALSNYQLAGMVARSEAGGEAILRAAAVLQRTGRQREALREYYRLAYHRDFRNSGWAAEALYRIGEIQFQNGSTREARKAFQRIVDRYDHSEWADRARQKLQQLNGKP